MAKHPKIRRILSWLSLVPSDKSEIPWSPAIFIHNIRKPLPFPDRSATVVYASHVLEHLYVEDSQNLMRECFRVLQPGGVLRVVVPDLHTIVEEYLRNDAPKKKTPDGQFLRPAELFNQRLLMRWPTPASSHLLYQIYNAWQDFHSHKWMYDEDSLATLFIRMGFIEVERRDCFHSRISDIQKVEDPSRIRNGEGVCVEGVKPTG